MQKHELKKKKEKKKEKRNEIHKSPSQIICIKKMKHYQKDHTKE